MCKSIVERFPFPGTYRSKLSKPAQAYLENSTSRLTVRFFCVVRLGFGDALAIDDSNPRESV
jgi:hypothetical protein